MQDHGCRQASPVPIGPRFNATVIRTKTPACYLSAPSFGPYPPYKALDWSEKSCYDQSCKQGRRKNMPTTLGNEYSPLWRGKYPHMLEEDRPVWERFLNQYTNLFERIYYDVRVGGVSPSH